MGSSEVIVVRYCSKHVCLTSTEVSDVVFDYFLEKEAVVISNYVLFCFDQAIRYFFKLLTS